MITAIKLPELGENIEEGEVLAVLVAVGDRIQPDQTLIELETNKASVEVPAPMPGVITALHVKPGDTLQVGGVIADVETETNGAARETATAPEQPPVKEVIAEGKPATPTREAIVATPRAPQAAAPSEDRQPAEAELPAPELAAAATPSVRRLARELGVDINEVAGTGPDGHISEQDVMRFARLLIQEHLQPPRGAAAAPGGFLGLPD